MRATSLGLGIAAAVGLWALGAIFGLNGHQWDWWRDAAYAEGGLVLLAATLRSTSWVSLPRSRGPVVIAGAALVASSVVVMARRYSDPYRGPLFWPHALAVIAFVGLTLVVAGIALVKRPPRDSR